MNVRKKTHIATGKMKGLNFHVKHATPEFWAIVDKIHHASP
jgi:hypothetical protein